MNANEIKTRLDLTDVVEKYIGQPARYAGRWVWWHCPFHHDLKKPSFGVTNDNGTFKCFGCGASGDHFSFVMLHKNVSFVEALNELGQMAGAMPEGAKKARAVVSKRTGPPGAKWQEAAQALAWSAQCYLWGEHGAEARAYLHKRGLNDDTISRWGLGWQHYTRYDKPNVWGLERDKDVWVPAGLVIPGKVGETMWYVKIRTTCGDPKYYKLPIPDGATSVALLGADRFADRQALLLCEKELDMFVAWQAANDLVDVGTFGGASNAHNPRAVNPMGRWAGYLMGYESVLLNYDDDDAGNTAVSDFEEISKRMKRIYTPHANDISAFAGQGGDVRAWIVSELQIQDPKLQIADSKFQIGYPVTMVFEAGAGLAAPGGQWRQLPDGKIEMTFKSREELAAVLLAVKAIGAYPALSNGEGNNGVVC